MTAILPWAATRGDAARAMRKIFESIFAVVWWNKKDCLKIEFNKDCKRVRINRKRLENRKKIG